VAFPKRQIKDKPSDWNKKNSRFPYLILAWNEGKGKRPRN